MSENAKLALFVAIMAGLIAAVAFVSMANGEGGDDDVPEWVKKDVPKLDSQGGAIYIKGSLNSPLTSRLWVSPEDVVRYSSDKGYVSVEKTDGSLYWINARHVFAISLGL